MVFNDGIHLVVDERLLVADGMFDPLVTGVLIVAYSNADRIVGHPDAVAVYIKIIDTIAVHGIIAVIIRHNIRLAFVSFHIHFIYTGTVCGYQYLFVIKSFDAGDTHVFQAGIELDGLMEIHVICIDTSLKGSYEELAAFFMKE